MTNYATYQDALQAWQQATRAIRVQQAKIDNAEAACAARRADQVAAQTQIDNLKQSQADAQAQMQTLV